MLYPFWPLNENVVEIVHLIENPFFYHLLKTFESVHIEVEELIFIHVQVGVGGGLNLFGVDAETFRESLGERSFSCSELSLQ